MRILYYNWVDYDDPERRGGGVSIYQRNIVDELAQDADCDVVFLSSGIAYDFNRRPYLRAVRSAGGVRKYEIVNSGVMAPGHSAFFSINTLSHKPTVRVFEGFLKKYGPFDIIHFNNLEGLPLKVLSVKESFPESVFILSLHNYFVFCPQVNLWYQEKEHCVDFHEGRRCVSCLPNIPRPTSIKNAHRLAFYLKGIGINPGTRSWDFAFLVIPLVFRVFRPRSRDQGDVVRQIRSEKFKSSPKPLRSLKPDGKYFFVRRRRFVKEINAYVDRVLAVSAAVAQIAADFGVDKEKIITSYIGTKQAERVLEVRERRALLRPDGTLVLAYLGYMRRDKGFYFLLDALRGLSSAHAGRIKLIVASPNTDESAMRVMEELSGKFKDILFADGYKHDELDCILAEATLGVVPVLWEDNLPQVAIEMYCRGISLLCSSRGGAKELGGSFQFTFRAGDSEEFLGRIRLILDGELTSKEFWKNHIRPVTVKEHVISLKSIYQDAALGQG